MELKYQSSLVTSTLVSTNSHPIGLCSPSDIEPIHFVRLLPGEDHNTMENYAKTTAISEKKTAEQRRKEDCKENFEEFPYRFP